MYIWTTPLVNSRAMFRGVWACVCDASVSESLRVWEAESEQGKTSYKRPIGLSTVMGADGPVL